MPEPDFISIFVSRLNRTGLPYMITGSVACIVYGAPRMTHDVDLVLDLGLKNVQAIVETLRDDGRVSDSQAGQILVDPSPTT